MPLAITRNPHEPENPYQNYYSWGANGAIILQYEEK